MPRSKPSRPRSDNSIHGSAARRRQALRRTNTTSSPISPSAPTTDAVAEPAHDRSDPQLENYLRSHPQASELIGAMQKAGTKCILLSRIEGQIAARAILADGAVLRADNFSGNFHAALWALGGALIEYGRRQDRTPAAPRPEDQAPIEEEEEEA